MNCIFLTVLLSLIAITKATKGEFLSLKIFKIEDSFEGPTSIEEEDVVQEFVGMNLTLVCKFDGHDSKGLQWGKRKDDGAQFENVRDLERIAKHPFSLLNMVIHNKNEEKNNELQFLPLTQADEGLYFCMNMKYYLFKLIRIKIQEVPNFAYLHMPVDNLPLIKRVCSDNPNFKDEHACDGVKDCKDGWDESIILCGSNPCEGKIKCRDGRCVSKDMCCHKFIDRDCKVDVRPSCCDEDKNDFGGKFPFHYNFDWPVVPLDVHPPVLSTESKKFDYEDPYDFHNKPDFDWPLIPPTFPAEPDNDNSVKIHGKVLPEKKSLKDARIVYIVVPCLVVAIIIVIILFILTALRNSRRNNPASNRRPREGPPFVPVSNNEDVTSISNRPSTTPSNSNSGCGLSHSARNINVNASVNASQTSVHKLDLPPSYAEAMADRSPTAPPLEH